MFKLAIIYTNIVHSKAQNIPKLIFWFATIWQPWANLAPIRMKTFLGRYSFEGPGQINRRLVESYYASLLKVKLVYKVGLDSNPRNSRLTSEPQREVCRTLTKFLFSWREETVGGTRFNKQRAGQTVFYACSRAPTTGPHVAILSTEFRLSHARFRLAISRLNRLARQARPQCEVKPEKWVRNSSGWPDDLVNKFAQKVAQNNICITFSVKKWLKILATQVIFQK
jgi:hypothetical protein